MGIEDETTHIPARFALRERRKTALDQAKVLMPYETIQLAPFEHRPQSAGRS